MLRSVAFVFVLTSLGHGSMAYAQARNPGLAATVTWTAVGAGAGFGIGLWAGLTVFDDAINSERKVWTSAAVGAAVGALGGYLVGRARRPHAGPRPMTAPSFPIVRTSVRCGPPGAECLVEFTPARTSSRLSQHASLGRTLSPGRYPAGPGPVEPSHLDGMLLRLVRAAEP